MATRGITAGSGTATTEMRWVLIHMVERSSMAFPLIRPTLYVDDLKAEAVVAPEIGSSWLSPGSAKEYELNSRSAAWRA